MFKSFFLFLVVVVALVGAQDSNPEQDVGVCGVTLRVPGNLTVAEELVRHIDPIECPLCCVPFYEAAQQLRRVDLVFNNTLGAGVRVITANQQTGLALFARANHPQLLVLSEKPQPTVVAFFFPFTVPAANHSVWKDVPEGLYARYQAQLEKSEPSTASTSPSPPPKEDL